MLELLFATKNKNFLLKSFLVEVCCEPELEVPVHLVGVDHGDDQLLTELQTEVAVLQHQPVALQYGVGDGLPGPVLLPLPHGDLVVLLLPAPGQALHHPAWVRP